MGFGVIAIMGEQGARLHKGFTMPVLSLNQYFLVFTFQLIILKRDFSSKLLFDF
jgi:hypothetical protein